MDLLWVLGTDEALENDGLGVVRIAEEVGREKSQVSRALKHLAADGLVERDPDTLCYRLGWTLFTLAARAGDRRLRAVAPAVLRQLVRDTGETAHLNVLIGTDVLTIATEESSDVLRATGAVGRRVPAWCTSSGRALQFDMDADEVRTRFATVLFDGAGPNEPRSLDEVLVRLAEAEARGVAIADEEMEPEVFGIASPVRDVTGRVVASLNISGPKFRLARNVVSASVTVRRYADRLSEQLGHRRAETGRTAFGEQSA